MKKTILAVLMLLITIYSATALTLDKDNIYQPSNSNISYVLLNDLEVNNLEITENTLTLTLTDNTNLSYKYVSDEPITVDLKDLVTTYSLWAKNKKEEFPPTNNVQYIDTSYEEYEILTTVEPSPSAGGGTPVSIEEEPENDTSLTFSVISNKTIEFDSKSKAEEYKLYIIGGIALFVIVILVLIARNKD